MAFAVLEPFTVVLIEDDENDERLILRGLNKSKVPIIVRVARDGAKALEALGLSEGTEREVPDLVISDLKVPLLNGDEVLQRARADERLSKVPYVMLSSSDEESCIDACLGSGASAFACKPVEPERMIDCASEIVRKWLRRP